MEHEREFIKQFVIKERQDRYLNLISSTKGREKFRKSLPHFKDIIPYRIFKISGSTQTPTYIVEQLRLKGSPEFCYIICEHSEYDTKVTTLNNALDLLFSRGLTYIFSCVPGKLAYFEDENLSERYLIY